jgi:hypothetical protein
MAKSGATAALTKGNNVPSSSIGRFKTVLQKRVHWLLYEKSPDCFSS